MKVNRKKLLAELRFVAGAAERKATIPILTHALWRCADGVLHLVATNLDLTLSTSLEVEGGGEDLALAVPAKASIDLLSRLAGESVEVVVEHQVWKIRDETTEAQLFGLPADEWPVPPEPEGEPVEVEAERFRRAVASVSHAAGQVESRFQLAGAATSLNGSLTMMATDGNRLSVSGELVPNPGSLPILPIDALRSATAVEGERFTIYPGRRHWTLEASPRRVILRPIEGTFPDASRTAGGILATCIHSLTVNRLALLAAVNAAEAVPDERETAVGLEVDDEGVLAVTKRTTLGEARITVPATVTGDAVRLGFGAFMLADLLNSVEGDEITLHYLDGNQALVYAEGDEYRVVMPRTLR